MEVIRWSDSEDGGLTVKMVVLRNRVQEAVRVADFIQDSSCIIPAWLPRSHPEVCNLITSLPISNNSQADKLAWEHSIILSVREVYLFTKPLPNQHNWCKKIWSSTIPPSKSFVTWRRYNNKMLIDENLKASGFSPSDLFAVFAKSMRKHQSIFSSFATLFELFGVELKFKLVAGWTTLQVPASIAGVLWLRKLVACILNVISTIWYYRNKSRFENVAISTDQALTKIKTDIAFIGNFSKLCAKNSLAKILLLRVFKVKGNFSKSPSIIEVMWQTPSLGWVKINSDGIVHGSPSHAGGGGIFRNNNGGFLGCFASYFSIQLSLYAELLAAILAVNIVHSYGWFSI